MQMQATLDAVSSTISGTNVMVAALATMFTLLALGLFAKRKSIDCMDLFTDRGGKLSRTAVGQVMGVIIAAWAPVYTTLHGKLEVEVLMVSLAYLGLVEGYAKWLRYKADTGPANGETASKKDAP